MMFVILLLVVAVAAFNIVATLVMVVKEKRTDIAILRTLGAGAAQRAARSSPIQGVLIGLAGTLGGAALGWLLVATTSQALVRGTRAAVAARSSSMRACTS